MAPTKAPKAPTEVKHGTNSPNIIARPKRPGRTQNGQYVRAKDNAKAAATNTLVGVEDIMQAHRGPSNTRTLSVADTTNHNIDLTTNVPSTISRAPVLAHGVIFPIAQLKRILRRNVGVQEWSKWAGWITWLQSELDWKDHLEEKALRLQANAQEDEPQWAQLLEICTEAMDQRDQLREHGYRLRVTMSELEAEAETTAARNERAIKRARAKSYASGREFGRQTQARGSNDQLQKAMRKLETETREKRLKYDDERLRLIKRNLKLEKMMVEYRRKESGMRLDWDGEHEGDD